MTSVCSQERVSRFCARRGWQNCTTTSLIYGLTLTLVAYRRGNILLRFARLVLSGPDIPPGCFDPIRCRIAKLRVPILSVSDYFCISDNPGHRPINYYERVYGEQHLFRLRLRTPPLLKSEV